MDLDLLPGLDEDRGEARRAAAAFAVREFPVDRVTRRGLRAEGGVGRVEEAGAIFAVRLPVLPAHELAVRAVGGDDVVHRGRQRERWGVVLGAEHIYAWLPGEGGEAGGAGLAQGLHLQDGGARRGLEAEAAVIGRGGAVEGLPLCRVEAQEAGGQRLAVGAADLSMDTIRAEQGGECEQGDEHAKILRGRDDNARQRAICLGGMFWGMFCVRTGLPKLRKYGRPM